MSKKSICPSLAWGQFRFSIVGTLLARPPSKGELGKELEKLANRHYLDPIKNEPVKFSFSTIERWYYQALSAEDPIYALSRKVRSDTDQTKVMTSLIIKALEWQYKKYPDWSCRLHSDNLSALIHEKPELGNAPSYSTINRYMKKRGWYKKKTSPANWTKGREKAERRLEKREVRGFEAEFPNALWHLDFHQGKRLADVNGEWHTPVCLCILDDHSRLCCHIQWFLSENSQGLYHGLCQAFHKRGLPRSLMTDNGSAMIAHETQNGLKRLGIFHETTLPYSAYQNGKQESFWGQLEGRLMKMLSHVTPLTLEFLNYATQAWAEMEYNRSYHEEINQTPLERYVNGNDMGRNSPESKILRSFFTVQETRTQRKSDGTVKIKSIRFEIPSRFRTLSKLHVCYQSWDLSMAYIVCKKTGKLVVQIYPQDKVKNAEGIRRGLEPLCEEKEELSEYDNEPHPPLLRKILTDYAATGLPPAYIPLVEKQNMKKESTNEK